MSQYSNKNLIMETEGEEHLEILHNFEDFEDMMQDLTMPMAKELFMAHLGLSKLTSTSDTQSNSSSYYLVSSQESKRISSEEKTKCHHIEEVQHQVEQGAKEREILLQTPREEPLHKMIRWLLDLPQRCDLTRLSLSALRCNECHLCEGVEYPCTHCGQQFHQECHGDQGKLKPHRLCPTCTRNNIEFVDR
ncbi:uncharacterized protein LOC6584484 [Drosophila mojavensis]|uniref:Uncharacterized protein n=1 Tax=Drosophila mojavensis TaxID=7230 RepID=B4L4H8_DROMO|nr:uncharacterized protein LOC6584484 [Drosophila mojavensis]EDW07456.2 uncharacterized protein Dmoj_GI14861 [Drosophila mojavensis]